MAEWYCAKDNEKMQTAEISLLYLEIDAKQEGLRCPKCGASYITEEVAMDRLSKAEKMIEQK